MHPPRALKGTIEPRRATNILMVNTHLDSYLENGTIVYAATRGSERKEKPNGHSQWLGLFYYDYKSNNIEPFLVAEIRSACRNPTEK